MRERSSNQNSRSVTDVRRNNIFGQSRKSMPGAGCVNGVRQIFFRVDERAIEIEDDEFAGQLSTGFKSDFFFFRLNCSSQVLRMSFIPSRNASLMLLGASAAQRLEASIA